MSINSLNSNVLHSVFSFLKPSEEIQCRTVCSSWNHLISSDPRWRKLANELNDKNVASIDLQKNTSFLPDVRKFCEKVDHYFLQYFPAELPKNKREFVDDMKGALVKLHYSSLPVKTRYEIEVTLHKQLEEAIRSNSDQIIPLLEKMQIRGFEPRLVILLQRELSEALRSHSSQVPAVLEKMSEIKSVVHDASSKQKCLPFSYHLELAIDFCPEYVPDIVKAMDFKPHEYKVSHFGWLCSIIHKCPQHVPLYLQAMRAGGNKLENEDPLSFAITESPEHIPMILQAMKEDGVKVSRYAFPFASEHCPEYAQMIKDAFENP